MAMRLASHQRDRVKKGMEGMRSYDLADFPELYLLQPGDMLMWDPSGQDGVGYWTTSSQLFGKDISANSTLIRNTKIFT